MSKVSKAADFEGGGLLQFEYGYDGDFRAPDVERDQALTASVLFNATDDLQFELDFDTVHGETNASGEESAGIGDSYFGAQLTALSESSQVPSMAFAYRVTIPTADAKEGLGTGRVDHKLSLLLSKKVSGTDVDFNASLLVNGDPATHGWGTGYQIALGVSREIDHRLSLQGEIFRETLDTDQPRGSFVQGGFMYQATERAIFDLGVRAGLTSNAPGFGFLCGVSFNLANVYGR